jgi:hypothetical protein
VAVAVAAGKETRPEQVEALREAVVMVVHSIAATLLVLEL